MAKKRAKRPTWPTDYRSAEKAVWKWVESGKFDRAIAYCEKALSRLPTCEYHQALGRSWLDQTDEAARWLARFYKAAKKSMEVRSLYFEMNRFEINPDRWYVDGFAYDLVGDMDDLDWLCGWKKATGESCFVLKGMRDLQRLFKRDKGRECPDELAAPSDLVILLLTLRMQQLVDAAARTARQNKGLPEDVPVFAAAHDCDLISTTPLVMLKHNLRP